MYTSEVGAPPTGWRPRVTYFQMLCHPGAPWHHVWCHGSARTLVMWPFAIKGQPMPHLRLSWLLTLGVLFVCSSGLPLPPTYGWCLTHVGHDVSSASPGWSLLPSSVIIVLALVNSAVSPKGTYVSQWDLGVSPHSLSVPLPQDCCAFWLVPMCIVVEVSPKWSAWLPPRAFRIRCVTYIYCEGVSLSLFPM